MVTSLDETDVGCQKSTYRNHTFWKNIQKEVIGSWQPVPQLFYACIVFLIQVPVASQSNDKQNWETYHFCHHVVTQALCYQLLQE